MRGSIEPNPLAKIRTDTHHHSIDRSIRSDRHVREASAGVATGQAQIWVDDQGTNSIVIVAGANAELSPEDVQAAEPLIAEAAVVVVRLTHHTHLGTDWFCSQSQTFIRSADCR
jgi:sugar/nucleoside kinase (ribokinase family)